jgi:hypothetical protein
MVYYGTKILTIDCHKIRAICVSMINDQRVNGVRFHEISFVVVELQVQCGRKVIGLALDSSFGGED